MITAEQLSRASAIIARHGLNIDRIERLSGRKSLAQSKADTRACIQLSVSGAAASPDRMRADLMELTHELPLDVAFQRESIHTRNRRLVAFDMDSTLIQAEVIDELAKLAGVGDQVTAITESAMRGELDFKQSFTKRVSLLRGLPESRLREVIDSVPLTDGAERLITTLKSLGYKTAILSGGFNFVGHRLQEQLGIDYLYSNELEIADGLVTGRREWCHRRRSAQSRTAAGDRCKRRSQSRPGHCCRRRCQRSTDVEHRRTGHRISRQAAGTPDGAAGDLNARTGWNPLPNWRTGSRNRELGSQIRTTFT